MFTYCIGTCGIQPHCAGYLAQMQKFNNQALLAVEDVIIGTAIQNIIYSVKF